MKKYLSLFFLVLFTTHAFAADRYWVGGTATWDATAGSKWATTSGGTGGETVPGTGDNVFFDAASGAVTVATSGTSTCNAANLDFTGFTGTFSATASTTVNIRGSLTLASGMTLGNNSGFFWDFEGTSTGHTITTAGKTMRNIIFDGVGGGWTLQDSMTATGSLTIDDGIFNTNGQNVTVANIDISDTTTRTFTITNSTIHLTSTSAVAVWEAGTTTNLTLNSSGSTIILDNVGANAQTFSGGGLTYAAVQILADASSGAVTISGSNTFSSLTIGAGGPKSIILTSGTTQTFSTASSGLGNGTNVVTFTETGGTDPIISCASGTFSWDYVSLTAIPASAGATFYAGANSTDGGGNTNWIFTAPPAGSRSIIIV